MKKYLAGLAVGTFIGVTTLVGIVFYYKGRNDGMDWCLDQMEELCGCHYE